MHVWRAVERPADRSTVRWALDAAVAVAAGVTAAVPLFADGRGGSHADAVVVIALVVAPLAVRRIWPLPVFAWVVLCALGAGVWNHGVVCGLAVLIALYTVASMRPRRTALGAFGLLLVWIIVGTVAQAGSRWWSNAIFLTGLIAAALALGLYAATRRAYLGELRDRTVRLERERDQQGELAAAAERSWIAREMHDIVAHHLTVMIALSDGAVAASATAPEKAVDVMRTVSATGRAALEDTRRLLGVLRQESRGVAETLSPVPDLGALDALVDGVRAAGLATTLEVRGAATQLPPGVQLTVYRLVQEALTNTLKHGGGQARAAVRLSYLPGRLHVDIDDDGAGLPPKPVRGVGGGLSGMRERVGAYGGQVQAGPRDAGGWRVSAQLQLTDTDPGA